MIPIEELYPNHDPSEYMPYFGSYDTLTNSFGYEVVIQVDDNDYQGDTRVLFQNGDSFGYLNFGWGSCSVCDALQGCETLQEVDDLRHRLHDSIQWFADRGEALEWFKSRDWEGTYEWHIEETKQFVAEVIEFLDTKMLEGPSND